MADRWREGLGKEIENPDQHFRLVYVTNDPAVDDRIPRNSKTPALQLSGRRRSPPTLVKHSRISWLLNR